MTTKTIATFVSIDSIVSIVFIAFLTVYSHSSATTQETLPAFLAGSVSLKGGGDLLSRIAVQYHRRARA